MPATFLLEGKAHCAVGRVKDEVQPAMYAAAAVAVHSFSARRATQVAPGKQARLQGQAGSVTMYREVCVTGTAALTAHLAAPIAAQVTVEERVR